MNTLHGEEKRCQPHPSREELRGVLRERCLTPGGRPQRSARENGNDHTREGRLVPAFRIWK